MPYARQALRHDQSGQGLLMTVIFIMIILLALSITILAATFEENLASFLNTERKRALQAAETGVEDAKIRITRRPADNSCAPGPSTCTTSYSLTLGDGTTVSYDITLPRTLPATTDTGTIVSQGTLNKTKRKIRLTVTIDSKGNITPATRAEERPA